MTHYPEAKADLEESLRLAEEIGSARRRSHARTNLGLVLRETGRLEEAASSYRIALELARKNNDKRTVLSCYQNIGNIYRELGRWDAGKKALHGAIDLALELGDVYQELIARQNMDGLLLEEGKDLEKVVGGAEDLMGKARSIGADQVARRTRSNLALALVRMGRADEALEQARIAVEEAVESRDNYVLWRARANLARAYRVLGEIDEAERAFGETLADFDALRRTLTTDRDRAEFKRNLQNLQDEYVSFTLESKGPGAALARLARSKGRALMEFRTGSGKDLTGAMSDEELTSSICRAVHDREGSILLDFFSHEGRLMVFLCCGEKVTVHDLEITMDRVKSLLDEFSKEISLFIASREYRESPYHADSNPPESLMELGRALIGPTWDRIAGFRNLLIVPHGALHHVPFQALVMGNGSYLVRYRFAVERFHPVNWKARQNGDCEGRCIAWS
jgi:tetratricopeptide (TPR) repeat protein